MSGEEDDYYYTKPDGSKVPKHVDAKGNPISNVPIQPTKIFSGEITANFDAPVSIASHDELGKHDALVKARELRGINSPTTQTEAEYYRKLQKKAVKINEYNGINEDEVHKRQQHEAEKLKGKNRKRREEAAIKRRKKSGDESNI